MRRWIYSVVLVLAGAMMASHAAWAAGNIAVFGGTDGAHATQHIADDLIATGGFNSVTILDGSESPSTLSGFSSILFYTNVGGDLAFADKMAQFVAAGGHLVAATFLMQADAMGGANGLGDLAGLMPFVGYGGNYITQVSLAAYDDTSPIMDQVSEISAFYHDNTSVAPGARLVASWSDGNPLVAISAQGVIGINLFPNDAYGYVYGDYVRLFENALGGAAPRLVVNEIAVPEPAPLAVLGVGLIGLAWARRRFG